jgi:hypothetical protein
LLRDETGFVATMEFDMKYLNPSRCMYLAAGIALLATFVCSGEQASAQTPKLPSVQPRVNIGGLLNANRLTPEIQPREAKTDNGEVQRIVYRNGMGIVRKIEISYENKLNASAVILKDEHGNVTEATLTTPEGTSSGRNGIRGITDLRWVSPTGVLLLQGNEQDGGYKLTRFSDKDGSPVLVQVVKGDKHTVTLYENNKVVAEAEYDGKVRLWLKVYFEDSGRLQYEEKMSQAASGGGEIAPTILEYVGTIYNSDGKATHRVHFNEGPYDGGVGKLTKVELLADDGSATQTIPVDYPSRVKIALGSYKDQDELIEDKRIVFATGDNAHNSQTTIEGNLVSLLADTTK